MTKEFFAVLDIEFIGGTLQGLFTRQHCRFPTHAQAEAYADQMRGAAVARPVGMTSPYLVHDAWVEHVFS
jgi:hypothetical protein